MAKAEYRSAVRSRKLICRALVDLIEEKPLDKITVTDVVTRADINRGTFYAHYANIPDVLDTITEDGCRTIRTALAGQEPGTVPDPEVLLRKFQEALQEDLTFYQKVLTNDAAAPLLEKLRAVFLEYMLRHEADFHVTDHDRYVLVMRIGSGGVVALYRDWLAGKVPMTLDELTENAAATVRRLLQDA